MRKRRVLILLLCALLALGLAGCGGGETPSGSGDAAPAEGETLTVVATIFPAYDWIRNLVGDVENVDVRLLCGDGTDLHSFQPSAADIVTIASADLFVYVGGESDAWVAEALAGTGGEGQQAIALLDALGGGALEEETVEGMEGEEEESGEEAPEYDEHVWLSLKNAKQLCTEIDGALQALDPANAEAYQANLEGYLDQLDALDGQYETAVKEGRVKTLLFADRFPFRYLTEDYGLDYYAAFSGCSAETEASFETVAFLAKKTEELDLGAVLTIETGDGKLAQTVVDAAGSGKQKILTLDSMQAVTAEEAAAGATYLDIMEQNLAALKEALS